VDPVLDFDYASARTSTYGADAMIRYVRENDLVLAWIIETHVHADHLSSARYIGEELGGRIGIGANIDRVQATFAGIFNEPHSFATDGSQFDHLFVDGEAYRIGNLEARAMWTPGHTPACMAHIIGDAVFVGDTIFMPDGGTARADFPGGDAGELYDSIQKILSLPDDTRIFVCHDYGPGGRDPACETTVAEQAAGNIHLGPGVDREAFVAMRTKRDATLNMPRLIIPSVQVNMRAGRLPRDPDGREILKVPINTL
jgi:glyoxylase-like metal-dependent hydrolase (beta-lactamase superfamily II)